jgi:hypothetical protein
MSIINPNLSAHISFPKSGLSGKGRSIAKSQHFNTLHTTYLLHSDAELCKIPCTSDEWMSRYEPSLWMDDCTTFPGMVSTILLSDCRPPIPTSTVLPNVPSHCTVQLKRYRPSFLQASQDAAQIHDRR